MEQIQRRQAEAKLAGVYGGDPTALAVAILLIRLYWDDPEAARIGLELAARVDAAGEPPPDFRPDREPDERGHLWALEADPGVGDILRRLMERLSSWADAQLERGEIEPLPSLSRSN